MAVELVIASEAAQDIDEAYGWYEGRRTGLGEEFLSCVDGCIQGICRLPEMHAKVHKEYRRALVRRFPYVVFYEYVPGPPWHHHRVLRLPYIARSAEVASASA